jgi:hypothetical protein
VITMREAAYVTRPQKLPLFEGWALGNFANNGLIGLFGTCFAGG